MVYLHLMMITSFLVDLPNAIESIDLCRRVVAILLMILKKYSRTGSGLSIQTEVHDSFQTIQEKLSTGRR